MLALSVTKVIMEVNYPSSELFKSANEQHLQQGGLFIGLTEFVDQYSKIDLEIYFDDGGSVSLNQCLVVWSATEPDQDGLFKTSLQLQPEQQQDLQQQLNRVGSDSANESIIGQTEDGEQITITAGGEGNLFANFEKLSRNEQIQLALKGNRPARQLILRKGSAEIMRFLLQNPKLSEYEVAEIAASRSSNQEMMEAISKNKDWMKIDRVRYNLIKNYNTPVPVALRFVPFLKVQDMNNLLKTRALRKPIETAIRRIVLNKK